MVAIGIVRRPAAWGICLLLFLLGTHQPAKGQGDGAPPPPRTDWLEVPRETSVEYDREANLYLVYQTVGGKPFGAPRIYTPKEYDAYRQEQMVRAYWRQRAGDKGEGEETVGGIIPKVRINSKNFDRIFGSNTIEVIPQGTAEVQFGINNTRTDNYTLPEEMRSNTAFDFQAKLRVNVTGKIGEKLRLDVKYDTEATFNFEQNIRLEYTGFEDEIIQKIIAGNVSFPLPGTLITGSQNLFGARADLRFGNLDVSVVASQRKGQSQTIEVRGGAQSKEFLIAADGYEANRHFFLSRYFRDNYDLWLRNLPIIGGGVEITRVEVWVTNKQGRFDDSRDILAFVDLGEPKGVIAAPTVFAPVAGKKYPDNGANGLYQMMSTGAYSGARTLSDASALLAPLATQEVRNGRDYERLENARLLKPTEYTINTRLGYISLNMALNADEVLCVAYEYTVQGRTYRVGDLSTGGVASPKALYLKLLKGTELSPKMPTWMLMMKNIYPIGSYQVSQDGFELDVLYQDDNVGTKVNYLDVGGASGRPLLSVMSLDHVNSNGDQGPDGIFDFIDGVTVIPQQGRIVFPVIEPFGSHLAKEIGDPELASRVAFTELYDSTLSRARQVAEKSKFYLRGTYRSSAGSEIPLNAPNVPRGSVVVTAGGRKLVENTDYVVDYLVGTVRIINQGLLESGTPIQVSLESDLGFDLQMKTLVGTHLNYRAYKGLELGATVMNMAERPFTKKVSMGQEAISNTIWGLDGRYETKAPWLTKAVDYIPFIDTKEESRISAEAEFAHFIPGQSRFLDKRGSVYIDDFEASKTTIDLRSWSSWSLASTPRGQDDLFPEATLLNDVRSGAKRSLTAWYMIDPLFLRNSALTPPHIRNNPDAQSSHFVREIEERELFPNRNIPQGQPTVIPILNWAFYPNERGPYNFSLDHLDGDGLFDDPQTRWGGIMRSLPLSDFESNNIEYVEFWMMDPFAEGMGGQGGDMYINLGNISEDILPDGRKFFEQGLPVREGDPPAEVTPWGKVPTARSSVMAFDNDPATRILQDVGLDGIPSTEEAIHHAIFLQQARALGLTADAIAQLEADPASDDFAYFRSTAYDQAGVSILDRYKRFNGTEGNSPTAEQSQEDYPTSASNVPDMEDINRDNTMSDNESYFQYRISLRKADLQVGRNNITDHVVATVTMPNGNESSVDWYQFKVPLKEFEKQVGYIEDFRSIRFIRMYLRGFDNPVVLRFASLALVRGEWRRYERSLLTAQESLGGVAGASTSFDISAVNIEENSRRTPVNYVLPPKVTREIDASQVVNNELNEQAMELKVVDLPNGDARAAYRNTSYDLRLYKTLSMDAHAEALTGETLKDGELALFIRLGSDYTDNYYEYEVPLAVTPPGLYDNNQEGDRLAVWPDANSINLELSRLIDLKLARDNAMRASSNARALGTPYSEMEANRRFTIVGRPSLSEVRVIMIGVRNPKGTIQTDDGYPKSGVVWVNELRLSKIADKGGWAAIASVNAQAADFANLTFSGRIETPGFGPLTSKLSERAKETTYQYDANGTFQLGKFFPSKWGVTIPLFLGIGETYATPQYNPLDEDVPFDAALDALPTHAHRDTLRRMAQDFQQRKSINVAGIRVAPEGMEARFYSPQNFSINYSYVENNARNVKTEYRRQHTHTGSIAYGYNAKPFHWEPFASISWLQNPHLALIRGFNLGLWPRQVSVRTEMRRDYMEQRLRNINQPLLRIDPTYAKRWDWGREYALNWDLTRALRFDFSATNGSYIDEPFGPNITSRQGEDRKLWRDSVWSSVRQFGRTTNYNHKYSLSYTLPFHMLPWLSWISSSASYSAEFYWEASPLMAEDLNLTLGNTIQNSQQTQLNAQAMLTSLYSRWGFLDKINQKFDKLANGQPLNAEPEFKEVKFTQDRVSITEKRGRTIAHNLGTKDVKVQLFDADGKPIESNVEILSDKRVRLTVTTDVTRGSVEIVGRKPKSQITAQLFAEAGLRLLMLVRSASVTRSETRGSMLPGYLPRTVIFGTSGFTANAAPGAPFLFGFQDANFAQRAGDMGWLTADTAMHGAYTMNRSTTWNYRVSLEPFPYFRIEVTGMRTRVKTTSAFYRPEGPNGAFIPINPTEGGSLNISTILIRTAFDRSSTKSGYSSAAFKQFEANRLTIARRLAMARGAQSAAYNPNATGDDGIFPDGYGPLAQEVLIPSLFAAYAGIPAENVALSFLRKIPMPNWQITYDGLSRFKGIKDVIRQLSLRHGYRSSYVVGNYMFNQDFSPDGDGLSYIRDAQQDFLAQYALGSLVLSEQFSPLAGFVLTLVNGISGRFEYAQMRSLALSFANNQLTETSSREYTVGLGYIFSDMPLVMQNQLGGRKVQRSELRLQADFSWRDSYTVLRRLVEGSNTPSAGQRMYAIKISADYMMSEQITLRLFFDRVVTTPLVSLAFPTANTSAGVSFRFSLEQ